MWCDGCSDMLHLTNSQMLLEHKETGKDNDYTTNNNNIKRCAEQRGTKPSAHTIVENLTAQ